MQSKTVTPKSAAAATAAARTETVTAFAHTSLDAYRIALEALARGDRIARELPRGYGPLRDQLSRALQEPRPRWGSWHFIEGPRSILRGAAAPLV